jgi:hypothetical protein
MSRIIGRNAFQEIDPKSIPEDDPQLSASGPVIDIAFAYTNEVNAYPHLSKILDFARTGIEIEAVSGDGPFSFSSWPDQETALTIAGHYLHRARVYQWKHYHYIIEVERSWPHASEHLPPKRKHNFKLLYYY